MFALDNTVLIKLICHDRYVVSDATVVNTIFSSDTKF